MVSVAFFISFCIGSGVRLVLFGRGGQSVLKLAWLGEAEGSSVDTRALSVKEVCICCRGGDKVEVKQ